MIINIHNAKTYNFSKPKCVDSLSLGLMFSCYGDPSSQFRSPVPVIRGVRSTFLPSPCLLYFSHLSLVLMSLVPDYISVPPTLFDVESTLGFIVDSLFCRASGHF